MNSKQRDYSADVKKTDAFHSGQPHSVVAQQRGIGLLSRGSLEFYSSTPDVIREHSNPDLPTALQVTHYSQVYA